MTQLRFSIGVLFLTLSFGCNSPDAEIAKQKASLKTVRVAVVDSGVDFSHPDLKANVFINPNEVANKKDDDHNGKIDDISGWNFNFNTPLVFDPSFINKILAKTSLKNILNWFEIEERYYTAELTAEDKAFVSSMKKDPNFFKALDQYGSYIHGTHVAGIAMRENPAARVLSATILAPSESLIAKTVDGSKKFFLTGDTVLTPVVAAENDLAREEIMKDVLRKIASQYTENLGSIFKYLNLMKVRVANGSFGMSPENLVRVVASTYMRIYNVKPTDEALGKFTQFFVTFLMEKGKEVVLSTPDILFVFAAGNDGMNTDQFPNFPSAIDSDNIVSVAATLGTSKLADFSNIGIKSVDLAAPGVTILSSAPGNAHVKLSGTSQACPAVANVAALIFSINPRLTPSEVKSILSGTVDEKFFLKGFVKTGGMLNREKAALAANYSLTMSLATAVKKANADVSMARAQGLLPVESEDYLQISRSGSGEKKRNLRRQLLIRE